MSGLFGHFVARSVTRMFALPFLVLKPSLLVLGVFLVVSDAGEADVECFASDVAQEPLDDSLASFHTDQYQAMYRVLMACSLLLAVIGEFIFISSHE